MDHSHAEHRIVRFEIDTSGSPLPRAGVVGGSEAVRGPAVLDVDGLGEASAFVLATKRDRPYAPLLL
ncbi:hypothetical protein [Streptomyces sp900116325]|uniref:hypothetical protein n=1 Tax=Streptomyces sp. 900116325 TaxID=3154295 RepID=UPI0033FBEC28